MRGPTMLREQYDHMTGLPRPMETCGSGTEDAVIDLLLRGWAEVIGDHVRITQAGRLAMAAFEAAPVPVPLAAAAEPPGLAAPAP